jgi:hypothetical protein
LVEGDLGLGLLNLGEERHEGLDEVEEPYCMQGEMVSALSRATTVGLNRAAQAARQLHGTRVATRPIDLQELILGDCAGKETKY